MLFNYQEFLDSIDRKAYHEGEWQWEEDGYTVTRTYTYSAPGCHDSCGVLLYVKDGKLVKVEGDPDHPITKGHLCLKGFANVQKINSPDRVKYPLLRTGERGEGKFRRVSWDEAMDWMVEKIRSIQKNYGPEAILEYCYSGNREHMAKAVAARLWNLMGASKLVGSFCLLSGVAGSVGTVGSQFTMDPQIWSEHAQTIFLVGRNCTATNPHIFPFCTARRSAARSSSSSIPTRQASQLRPISICVPVRARTARWRWA